MVYSKIKYLKGKSPIHNNVFVKALRLGVLVVYTNTGLELIDLNSCNLIFQKSGFYHVQIFEKKIFISIGNEVKELNLEFPCNLKTICKTNEKDITIHNLNYCIGRTTKRKPRIRQFELISTKNNRIVYKWSDDKELIFWKENIHLFQTRFKGNLYSLDIEAGNVLWEIIFDDGIPGKRYLEFIGDDFLIAQRNFNVENNNLIKLNLKSGDTLWETENTHSYYCFDKESDKLFGLGGNRFEVINVSNGKKELVKDVKVNGFISSHLTYYNDGFLYFSTHIDKNTPVFGAVNVNTGELDFIQEVKIEGEKSFRIGLEKPVVVDDRLYVKDSLNNLHVFEKTTPTAV